MLSGVGMIDGLLFVLLVSVNWWGSGYFMYNHSSFNTKPNFGVCCWKTHLAIYLFDRKTWFLSKFSAVFLLVTFLCGGPPRLILCHHCSELQVLILCEIFASLSILLTVCRGKINTHSLTGRCTEALIIYYNSQLLL